MAITALVDYLVGVVEAVARAADMVRVARALVGKREFSGSLIMILDRILLGCWSWRWRVVD